MTTLINGRTPAQHAAWNRWHLLIAVVLALLLLLLWLADRGPGHALATGSCCGVAATAEVAPAVPAVPTDSDGDGVMDADDACPGTPAGMTVEARGCEVVAAAPAVEAPTDAVPAPIPAANLYFELDKFDLPADAAANLAPIVEYLQANPSATAAVSGYHDPTGNRDHNIELAKNRALAVRADLVAQGIEQARIDMRKPIETTGSGSLEEARRVEVSIVQP
jgi:hypothetical protein